MEKRNLLSIIPKP